jgi:death-on-curing protein
MPQPEFLSLEDLLGLVRALGAGPVRDLGLLEAAAARPRTTLMGEDAYPSIPRKAAALLHSLVRNHALVDGNKRIGWLACVVFLDMNGFTVDLKDDDAFELVMDVAQGFVDLPDIVVRLGFDEG